MTREDRVSGAHNTIFAFLDNKQEDFIEFLLSNYKETVFEVIGRVKHPILLDNNCQYKKNAKVVGVI